MKKSNQKIIIGIIATVIAIVTAVTIAINVNKKSDSKSSENSSISDSVDDSNSASTTTESNENAPAANSSNEAESNNSSSVQKPSVSNDSKSAQNNKEKSDSSNKNKNSAKENNAKAGGSNSSDTTIRTSKGHDFSSWNASCPTELVVVNKDNELPDSFNLNLVSPAGVELQGTAKYVHSAMVSNLQKMFADAKAAGLRLYISSGYRSISHQQTIFNKKVNYYLNKGYARGQAEIEAAKVVAKPRTSEHNSGLAIDLNGVRDDFYTTKEYKWLMENAAKYGFILRYSKEKIHITNIIYEPWHFRYVGVEHALAMVKNNMCLEEYVKSLQS